MSTENESKMKQKNESTESMAEVASAALVAGFFSYDPYGGFEFHETEEAAREFTEAVLKAHRDDAPSDGWNDQVEGICWGRINQRVGELWRKKKEEMPEEEQYQCGEWDEIVDYGLLPANNKIDREA